jgi:hypothetical protein
MPEVERDGIRRGYEPLTSGPHAWPGAGGTRTTRATGPASPGGQAGSLALPADQFASALLRLPSARAFWASAFSPAVIALTSTTTFRMVPVNLVLAGS